MMLTQFTKLSSAKLIFEKKDDFSFSVSLIASYKTLKRKRLKQSASQQHCSIQLKADSIVVRFLLKSHAEEKLP